MKREARFIMRIFIICSVVVGAIVVDMTSWKVFDVAVQLHRLEKSAQSCCEQSEEYQAIERVRQKFCNSEDKLISFYSNSNIVIKIVIFSITVLFLVATPMAVVYLIWEWIKERAQAKGKREKLKRKVRGI